MGGPLHHLLIIPNDLALLSTMNDKNVVTVQLTAVYMALKAWRATCAIRDLNMFNRKEQID